MDIMTEPTTDILLNHCDSWLYPPYPNNHKVGVS